ncbi:MAG TPA: indole-3-glycerol phosphate synthase TrpC [Bryobacteraceae bacterium]|nr:indole-3-glycerol phosphate synthase TrpC [Bryobacteraceae bacterium]
MESGILDRIVARKREELREAAVPFQELRAAAEANRGDRRDFAAALRSGAPAIIAEIKKASPSRGVLMEDFRPAELASKYERGGAAALSVLTDHDFFQGSIEDLRAARAACSLPVLRKDFTISEYHLVEAAACGADAVLLIAAILSVEEMRELRELAARYEMAALVEVHDAAELRKAIASGAEIIGVNNRDLRTFRVSLDTSISLAPELPDGAIRVSESGIFTAADVARLMDAGYDAFLVGEHLVKAADPAAALRDLAQARLEVAPECS